MRSTLVISLVMLGALLLSGLGAFDATGSERPDPTPFGFTDDLWYQDTGRITQIDRTVERAVEELGIQEKLELVIQFYPPLTSADIEAAERSGMEVINRMTALPAIFARGDIMAVEELARYEGTVWIEHNVRMEFEMEMTTTTINASKVWDSPILDAYGKEYPSITGEGVTAVVLDSGVDAGHPDLDYGEKTVKNYKSDSDFAWREVENSDTSSGHGTHCAGTVAGNGDASGGARAGVAVGAKLIGLSTGEAISIFNGLGGLQWVYEHSRPGHTYEWDDPIRVVSNSWGPGPGDYDPDDALTKVCQRITFENNVIVVFAASNSGGEGDVIQTNPYGNVPSNIAVAAIERDGSGVASFSSRGQEGIITTYPDVGAPGVGIWSTAARRTFISMMTKQGADLEAIDPYYFAISGTSMATPHIAGVVCLLWQAYDGLKMSDVYEDAEQEKLDNWEGQGWMNDSRNLVHEIELILEASATRIQPSDEGSPLSENYVPQINETGWNGEPYDFAQGYGLVEVDRAVGITLALKELRTRDFNRDGILEYPDATVRMAVEKYESSMILQEKTVETDRFYSAWNGEWSRFANQTGSLIPTNHDTSKIVYIPEGAQEMEVTLTYDPWQTDENAIASLYVVMDTNGDGSIDWRQSGPAITDARLDTISLSGMPTGQNWVVNVEGSGISWQIGDRFRESQFREVRSEFTISLNLTFPVGDFSIPVQDPHAQAATWQPLPPMSSGTTVNITRYAYDLGEITPFEEEGSGAEEEGGTNWFLVLLLLAVVGVGAFFGGRYYNRKKEQQVVTGVKVDGEKP